MKEYVDIRLDEEWVQEHLGPGWGKAMPLPYGAPPLTRRVVLETNDPRLSMLTDKMSRSPPGPMTVIDFRKYDAQELAAASFLHLIITGFLDECGEECGTVYDDATACPRCGYGRRQLSPLKLDLRRIAKGTDLVTTIARGDEIIVSQMLAEAITECDVVGCSLELIEDIARKPATTKWYQLTISAECGDTVAPTRFAKDFFRPDTEPDSHCPEHHLSGLNLVSRVSVRASAMPNADILKTRNRYGTRSGLVMPSAILLISQHFYQVLTRRGFRGFRVEVADLIEN